MRRFTMIVALLLMVAMPMFAERVTPETARKVATTFLTNNGAKTNQLTDLSKAAGFPNLYIYTAEHSFMVMSADDCVQPILGYSLNGSFDTNDMPENVRGWLQGYNDEIQWGIDNRVRASAESAKQWKELSEGNTKAARVTTVVTPLIDTKWNQNKYYNNLCPEVSDGPEGHAYTGCVATAMAQIMYYYKHPAVGIGAHSYTWGTQTLSADFSATAYDWSNMQLYYDYYFINGTDINPEELDDPTSEQITAVATLMYHCGVSIDMSYGGKSTGGSSAFSSDVAKALKKYFNYSPDIKYKQKNNFDNEDWIDMVKNELNYGRPLEYSGSSGSSGHAFVCDGYDNRNYFHFNWGWAGHYDGYFSLSNLNTGANNESGSGNGTYTNNQAAIFGIQPATIGNADAPVLTATLIQETGVRNIQLTWNEVTGASSYQVFFNSELIHTTTSGDETSYTHVHVPYGTNTYYVRTVDANGNLSLPSNYESIILTFAAPTDLTATPNDDGIELSWSANENAVAYNVYCNGIVIEHNISATTCTDSRIISGELNYQVNGIDSFGDESDLSEAASITVPFSTPVVNDLELAFENNNPVLSWFTPQWCYPETASHTLNYGQGSIYYSWNTTYYAHRYVATDLAQYANMTVYKVSTYAKAPGTYTLYVYTNTANDKPDLDALAETRTLVCSSIGWKDIPLSHPVIITGETDLWIVMKQENVPGTYPVASFDLDTYNANACYRGPSLTDLSPIGSNYSISWFINTHLTDGTYTYNLYDGETKVNGTTPISNTSYLVENLDDNAIHQYTVKTNYYGGESDASNTASLALGSNTLTVLTLENNDNMTIGSGSTLTVTGDLRNGDAANLVLENGAQLIHNSTGVKATVKKDIAAYTSKLDGWNLIASPVTENTTPSEDNGFLGTTESDTIDLYYYSEPEHKWKNYKNATFVLACQQGYLYANKANTTLQFAGTLTPSSESVTISSLSHSATSLNGINLVGNPFACNATVDRAFYVTDENGSDIVLAGSDRQVEPCEGIFVQATDDNASVTFTKAVTRTRNQSNSFDLTLTQGSTTLDRARVQFNKEESLEKFSLNDNTGSQIYFPQDGKNFAVACISEQNELPLDFKAAENGTYTLCFEPENINLKRLHLIDNLTGIETDLLTTPSYTFEAKTSDYVSRFRLVFNSGNANDNNEDTPFAFVCDGEIVITGVETSQETSLQVIDGMGRIVRNGDAMNRVSTNGMTAGVYVLRLITAEGVRTQKIFVE